MKTRLCLYLVPWLLLACNNRQDSALFSDDLPAAIETNDGGTKAVVDSGGSESDQPPAAAGSGSAGGSTTTSGGSPPVGGTASDAGSTGESDPTAGAGAEPSTDPEPAVCGNGKLEAGEQCDDARHAGKDGCSSQCQVVCSDFGEALEMSADYHCYAGYDEADFAGAQAACVRLGAHLVSIGSATENELVNSFVRSSKFIGAFEDVELMSEDSAEYEWTTGEAFSYENWSSEQPDHSAERCTQYANHSRCYEHCAFMLGDGTWADQRCDLKDGYVCEWEPAGAE